MSLLKHLRNEAILFGVVCGAVCLTGYVAYQVLLDDEAKKGIADMIHTVTDSYEKLSNLVNEQIGTIMDEDIVTQNRNHIRDAWAELGF